MKLVISEKPENIVEVYLRENKGKNLSLSKIYRDLKKLNVEKQFGLFTNQKILTM